MFGAFLIDPSFWSRIGFLISYIATSLLALEVLRLVSTDANKRNAEKFLEQYTQQHHASVSPPRARRAISPEEKKKKKKKQQQQQTSVNIEELEPAQPATPPPRQVRAVIAPPTDASETLGTRKRTTSSASGSRELRHRTSSPSPAPLRRVRKRGDTLMSNGGADSRRRYREESPASESGSRHGSPRPRSREDKEKRSGLGLGRLVRGKV